MKEEVETMKGRMTTTTGRKHDIVVAEATNYFARNSRSVHDMYNADNDKTLDAQQESNFLIKHNILT